MPMTAKYCSRCRDRLAYMRPSSEQENQFYWANVYRQDAVTEEGVCEHCGQHGRLIYYHLPELDTTPP